ncbi:MAG: hypothetical protein ABIO81_01515 [Ginsengibacter sp.]
MERVSTLILKLQQQLEEKATAEQLLLTVQMLHAELSPKILTTNESGKVVVIMPAVVAAKKEYQNYNGIHESKEPVLAEEEKIIEVLQVDEKEIEEELEQIKRNAESKNKISANAKPFLLFDPVEDVPTLAHQTSEKNVPKEINETAGTSSKSLNERLKEIKTELAEKLTDAPIKDLRKAIGVNDRFLFINELFRGDEAMYERSIKTINNFSILAEAEYWIRRELKIKIGWTDADPIVKQFDQLVRRRFF